MTESSTENGEIRMGDREKEGKEKVCVGVGVGWRRIKSAWFLALVRSRVRRSVAGLTDRTC